MTTTPEPGAPIAALFCAGDGRCCCARCDGDGCAECNSTGEVACPGCDACKPEAAKAAEGEVERKCWCERCNPEPSVFGRTMIVCPSCGNKRCPHAEWHGFVCTGSNETGQVGTEPQPTAGSKDSAFSPEKLKAGWDGAIGLLTAEVGKDEVAKTLKQAAENVEKFGNGNHELPKAWSADEVTDPAGGGEEPWTKPVTTAQAKAEFDAALAADEAKRAAGGGEERVTHEEARRVLRLIRGHNYSTATLERYIDQQGAVALRMSAQHCKLTDALRGELKTERAIVEEYTKLAKALKSEVAELKAERDGLRDRVVTLEDGIRDHGCSGMCLECGENNYKCACENSWPWKDKLLEPQQSPTSAKVEPRCICIGERNKSCLAHEPPTVSPGRDRPVRTL